MSVRAFDTRFNLRTVVEAETAARPLVLTQAPATDLPSTDSAPSNSRGSRLKFDFGQLKPAPRAATPASVAGLRPAQFAVPISTASKQCGDTHRADVMRLTAVVDDLTSRLKKAQDRAVVAESHLQKTHTALASERTNATEKIKKLVTQLSVAHATESNLRSELSKAAKVAVPKSSNFKSAVEAAMAAEGAVEKNDKEVADLKSHLADKDVKIDALSSEIAALRTEGASLNDTSSSLQLKLSEAVKEAAEARGAEQQAVVELQNVTRELREAIQRAEEAEASAAAARVASVAGGEEVADQPSQTDLDESIVDQVVAPMQEPLPGSGNVACCAKCGSPPPDEQQLASDATAGPIPSENAPPVEAPVEAAPAPAIALDPIAMHAKYTQMRERVLKLTASIAKMQRSGQEEELLPAMIGKRDEVYKRARALKSQYDSIFGAVDPDSVVKLSGLERSNATRERGLLSEAGECEFASVGDAPRPPCTYAISFAREMAANNVVGGAFDFGSYDSGVQVGNLVFSPITKNGVVIGDDANEEDVEPTEHQAARNGMVKAVLRDMSRLLKHYVEAEHGATGA